MKTDRPFFDTNVLLYLLSENTIKAQLAEEIMALGGDISVQVLNEFSSVASRKLHMPYAEISDFLQVIRAVCKVQTLTIETHELGLEIAGRYGFSLYDSMIISAALLCGSTVLYTEDLQHGQAINEQLLLTNPFK